MGGLTDHITLEETGAMVVPFGVTALLPALTGLNRAREMLFLGERYEAQALLEMGVAWRVVADEQLIDSARETALRLAQLPPLSVRAMKRVLRHTSSADFEQALRLESEATVAGFMDPQTTRLRKDF